MNQLRSGIFLAPFHDLSENPILALERDMELLQHLDEAPRAQVACGCPRHKSSPHIQCPRCMGLAQRVSLHHDSQLLLPGMSPHI